MFLSSYYMIGGWLYHLYNNYTANALVCQEKIANKKPIIAVTITIPEINKNCFITPKHSHLLHLI